MEVYIILEENLDLALELEGQLVPWTGLPGWIMRRTYNRIDDARKVVERGLE